MTSDVGIIGTAAGSFFQKKNARNRFVGYLDRQKSIRNMKERIKIEIRRSFSLNQFFVPIVIIAWEKKIFVEWLRTDCTHWTRRQSWSKARIFSRVFHSPEYYRERPFSWRCIRRKINIRAVPKLASSKILMFSTTRVFLLLLFFLQPYPPRWFITWLFTVKKGVSEWRTKAPLVLTTYRISHK